MRRLAARCELIEGKPKLWLNPHRPKAKPSFFAIISKKLEKPKNPFTHGNY